MSNSWRPIFFTNFQLTLSTISLQEEQMSPRLSFTRQCDWLNSDGPSHAYHIPPAPWTFAHKLLSRSFHKTRKSFKIKGPITSARKLEIDMNTKLTLMQLLPTLCVCENVDWVVPNVTSEGSSPNLVCLLLWIRHDLSFTSDISDSIQK